MREFLIKSLEVLRDSLQWCYNYESQVVAGVSLFLTVFLLVVNRIKPGTVQKWTVKFTSWIDRTKNQLAKVSTFISKLKK